MYKVDPVEEQVRQGATLILNISSSPFWQGKREQRAEMLAAVARHHKLPILMVNQTGGNDSLIFDGTSLALNARGEVIAQGRSFAEDLVMVDTAAGTGDLHRTAESDDAATYAALVMGTRDYVRKCGFKQVLIAVSGGIDSALVTAIAVDALGKENVIGVGMPSPYSSEGSIHDSRALASNLGIKFETIPIDGIFSQFTEALGPLFAGRAPDVTEENIQSRIRGMLLMALSNKLGALVLTTGNKSEMAVGYCTLYGDMVGALAVIGDSGEDARVCAISVCESRARDDSAGDSGEAAFGGVAARAARYGFAAAVQCAGSAGGGLCGAVHADAGDCRSAGTRRCRWCRRS